VAKREIAERTDGQLAVEASTASHQIADAPGEREAASERRALRSLVLSIGDSAPVQARRPPRALAAVPAADDRRRLERDLHDGVQNELVALIVQLALTQQDPETPPALVETLAGLEARAQAALDSVRNIARGIYPPLLADFGLSQALRAQAARAAVEVRLMGRAPRGTEAAEEAVYFACSEAIQNAAKHGGRGTQVTLRLRYGRGSLAVRIADNGRGFDQARTPEGAGVENIRGRIGDLGGIFKLASTPGHGTPS
jgi:signal transduction histidine kinase